MSSPNEVGKPDDATRTVVVTEFDSTTVTDISNVRQVPVSIMPFIFSLILVPLILRKLRK